LEDILLGDIVKDILVVFTSSSLVEAWAVALLVDLVKGLLVGLLVELVEGLIVGFLVELVEGLIVDFRLLVELVEVVIVVGFVVLGGSVFRLCLM